MGGINARQSIGSEDLNHCIYTYNLLPYEFGMKVRSGFREWTVGIDTGLGGASGVRTLIPFDSAIQGSVDDRMFAVTNEGIWNNIEFGEVPVLEVAFNNNGPRAGYGTYAHYVTDAGVSVLFYADGANGLFTYANGVWAQATGITGPVIEDIKFVVVHKQRIWFITENSTQAWYLGIGAIAGVADPFFFGSKLRHGGTLEGLFNWSVDGGAGADDHLVAVGHAGDIVVYAGADPTSADWNIVGTYFIGQIPNTPRFGTEQGGELYLLSVFGVSSMNDILKGVDSNALESESSGITLNVASIIRDRMATSINDAGWDVASIPSEGGLLVTFPPDGSQEPLQLYYNVAAKGWGFWRGVPMACFDSWRKNVFFGTDDGRVMRMDVPLDEVLITPLNNQTNGREINFSILTAFNSLGSLGTYKRPKLIRPDFVSVLPPSHSSVCRYDYDTKETTNFLNAAPLPNDTALWGANGVGSSNWDAAVWGTNIPSTFPTIGGVWGTGRYVAIATRGTSSSETRLVGWDLIYDSGGPMI
tara:strand:+ start:24487 stop:26073 length:1587 start_codon:yes stop_codon:yes gene_type:complete